MDSNNSVYVRMMVDVLKRKEKILQCILEQTKEQEAIEIIEEIKNHSLHLPYTDPKKPLPSNYVFSNSAPSHIEKSRTFMMKQMTVSLL